MIPIYICEDNRQQLEMFSRIIRDYLEFEEPDMKLALAAADPYELLKMLREQKDTGLYFLDIDLQSDISGLELAQKIREHDPRGYIVFITTHSEMLSLTFRYQVEAMDFIMKDQPDQLAARLRQCIKTALQNYTVLQKKQDKIIPLKIDKHTVNLNQNDIIFIESDPTPHRLVIHTRCGIKRVSGSLKELENTLDSHFFRCHNSILANTAHIASFDRAHHELVMDNGEVCPVSLRMLAEMKKILGR